MAKFESAIGEISGRLGGLVFSKNKAGNYVKVFKRQNNPRTNLQTVERTLLNDINRAWAELNEGQRVAWRAKTTAVYDVFGNERTLSGRLLYIALCRNMQMVQLSLFTDPPADFNPPALPDDVVTMKQAMIAPPPYDCCFDLFLDYALWDGADTEWILRATRPLRNTLQNPGTWQRYIRHFDATKPWDGNNTHQYYQKNGEWDRTVYADTFSIWWYVQLMDRTNGIITSPWIKKCIYGQDTVVYTP